MRFGLYFQTAVHRTTLERINKVNRILVNRRDMFMGSWTPTLERMGAVNPLHGDPLHIRAVRAINA